MSQADVISLATLAVAILSGMGVPLMLYALRSSDNDRTKMKHELHERLDHLDECLDDTRQAMLSRMVTKEDLATHRMEIQETISRIREASSREGLALHERIMRIENKMLGLISNG